MAGGRSFVTLNGAALPVVLVLAGPALLAADGVPGEAAPPVAGIAGNTGLWNVLSAATIPAGQFSISTWYDRVNRNPGHLTISTAGFGGAVGIANRVELGVSFEADRHVLVGAEDELSFGQQALGYFGDRSPGSPPSQAERMPGSSLVPQLRSPPTAAGSLSGAAGYYNLLPFAGLVHSADAAGSILTGVKFGILSEENGAPFGLAIHSYLEVPIHKAIAFLLTHPVGTADLQFGFDGIVSKNLLGLADVYANVGYLHVDQPAHVSVIRLADELPLGFGLAYPRKAGLQFVAESTAEVFVGSHTPVATFGARDPVDVTAGLRGRLGRWLILSAGYRRPVNQFGGDKNGFVLSLGYLRPHAARQ